MKRFGAIVACVAVVVGIALLVIQPGGGHHARPHARTVHHYFVIAMSCGSNEVSRHRDRCWADNHPAMLPSALSAPKNR
jgi:hypothetical protein